MELGERKRETETDTDMVWHRERDRGEQRDRKRDRMVKGKRKDLMGKEGKKGGKSIKKCW